MPTTSGIYYTAAACEPTNWVNLAFAFLLFSMAICALTGVRILWVQEMGKAKTKGPRR